MGQCFSEKTWHSPNPPVKEGTVLKEIAIYHIRDAHTIISMNVDGYTPVSLVPDAAASNVFGCPCCWVGIPAGFSAMVTRFGKDLEGADPENPEQKPKGGMAWEPGLHCWLPWYKVARMVSNQSIIFDTPVKSCKTKDDVNVDIDVLIDFAIVDARTFVHGLGPEKLDDLLRASQEESLRSMVGEIEVDNIFDLYGKETEKWVIEMNKMFLELGVKIKGFTVKNVKIPDDMATHFEQTTLYESKTVEKQRQQEVDTLAITHDEEKQELEDTLKNTKMSKEEETVTIKAKMSKEVEEVIANSNKELQLAQSQRKAALADLETGAMVEFAQLEADTMKLKREVQCKLDLEVGKLQAEADAYEIQKRALARMEAVEKVAEGKKAIAEAEGDAIEAFKLRRHQEAELARLDIVEKLANNRNIQIASSQENNTGLAPDNSLVAQVAQQGLEAVRMKLAEMTAASAAKLDMGKSLQGGLVRPVPQQQKM
jgi:regulator of protease activity HflC (stomatin/prohibitin superfamily)